MTSLFEKLYSEGKISEVSLTKIKAAESQKVISVHWDLKTLLYLGVLVTTSGLGILVYKNIDSIGHEAVIAFLALVSFGCYAYCCWKKTPFSWDKTASPSTIFDYILLLSCICFVILIGYWQFQFHIFGNRYGLETFIPMLVLFFTAYFFDHLGILSLAITNLAAWVGVVVTPSKILKENDFNSSSLIYAGSMLAILLVLLSTYSSTKKIKAHFAFTYANFGMHIGYISMLAGLFHFENSYLLWLFPLCGAGFYFYREAIRQQSFYTVLVISIYSYIAMNYIVTRLFFWKMGEQGFYFLCLYFMASATGMILLLIRMNKKLKAS
ncbi:MAG: DUF2157 domain-containing protein [Bacteroidetes bacterium]|nr:MAG: DUF2157 domain-containing protein [Bacteroidota bacterium]